MGVGGYLSVAVAAMARAATSEGRFVLRDREEASRMAAICAFPATLGGSSGLVVARGAVVVERWLAGLADVGLAARAVPTTAALAEGATGVAGVDVASLGIVRGTTSRPDPLARYDWVVAGASCPDATIARLRVGASRLFVEADGDRPRSLRGLGQVIEARRPGESHGLVGVVASGELASAEDDVAAGPGGPSTGRREGGGRTR